MRLRLNQDVITGLLLLAFGGALLFLGQGYSKGTMLRIGPGVFPFMTGCLLVLVAVALMIRGVLKEGISVENWAFRPVIIISGCFFLFAAMIETIGLAVTGIAVMCLASFAGGRFNLRRQLLVIALVPLAASILFITLLGVPMKFWPWG